MATTDDPQPSLMSLEDELTCSICLSPFDCPVTIPCGHNFCRGCLLATWEETYSCPQCRTHFTTKPELKKNTVLSTVVETFNLRSKKSVDDEPLGEKQDAELQDVIRCDTCMEAEAAQTCLTCMASFCEQHLRPHRENPIFRPHQLVEPVGDLLQRICPDHHKLMELFCTQHVRPICSLCLQQVHRGCPFTSPEEQRTLKEQDLIDKLDLLDGKISHNRTIIDQMRDMQDVLMDSAVNRKQSLAAEYQQIHDMLTHEESVALNAVSQELESGQTKLRGLTKKFTENIDRMSKAQEDIRSLLGQSTSLAFLQASFNLPSAVNFDPYTPRINLDSKKVMGNEAFVAGLKEHLTELFKHPVEARLQTMKPGEREASASGFRPFSASQDFDPSGQPRPRNSQSADPDSQPRAGPRKNPPKETKKPHSTRGTMENMKQTQSMENLLFGKNKAKGCPAPQPNQRPETSNIPPNITTAEKRSDLLKYGTALTLDPKTAHRRIILNEELTIASVTDEQANYPDCPQRFGVCSQVLTSQSFSRGRHYWEVRLSCNNFIGVGLTYRSIDRKGPTSRLGRNAQSWCVEWFNVKLSAWHNSRETVLSNPNPKRVGVLLDREDGVVTFYNVSDRAYPLHRFAFPFTEAVFPAFWMFSSGSSISLCKLQ